MLRSKTIAAALLLAGPAGSAAARGSGEAPTLTPGTQREATLAAGVHADFSMTMPAHRAAELQVQQLDGTLRVRVTNDAGAAWPALQNDAGRQARLRFTLIGERRSAWHLEIATRDPGQVSRFRLTAGPLHEIADADRQRTRAEQLLAEAEELRRAAGNLELGKAAAAATPERIRASYEEAIEAAMTAGAACVQLMANAGRARYEFAVGQYAAARDFARAALTLRCGNPDDPSALAEDAVAQRTLGSALGYLGDFAGANEHSEQALTEYRRTGDANFQAMLLANLSANYRTIGATQKALDAAGAALEIAAKIGDRRRAAFCRESIAAIHLQRGEWGRALDAYRQTIDALRSAPYPLVEAMSWNDMGLLYRQLGEDDESQQAYAKAEQIWTATNNQSGLAETLLNEGDLALDAGRLEAARATFERSLEFDRSNGFRREEAHALIGLGRVALASGDFVAAHERLAAARKLAHEVEGVSLEAAALLALGDVESRQNHAALADAAYREANALAQRTNDFATQVTSAGSRARIALATGDAAQAVALLVPAIDLIESERAEISSPALRTSYFASQRAYYDLGIEARSSAKVPAREAASEVAALELAERARARALRDQLIERNIAIRPRAAPALLAEEQRAEDDLREAAWEAQQLPAHTPTDATQPRLDAASRRLDQARAAIGAADPRFAALAHPPAFKIEPVQKSLLDDDVAVLEYWLGDAHSHLWRITRTEVRHWLLPPRADIERSADALRTTLIATGSENAARSFEARADAEDGAAWQAQAAALARIVLPAAATAGARTLVVVADGTLQRISFAALEPRSAHAFVYLPSLAALYALRSAPRPDGPPTIAIFVDPVFRADDPRVPAPVAATAASGATGATLLAPNATAPESLAPLRHAIEEAAAIGALFEPAQATLATGFDASRAAALATDWSRTALVHFASHAVIDLRHPDLSGIVLSTYDRAGNAQDGFLRMTDIYNLRMPVDLVVLSVCDPSREVARGAEGIFGLSRAFFYAGAHRLLLSLWPTDDRASSALMAAFYGHLLHEHRSPQDALQAAQADLQSDARWRAAYYWAGFVVQGDWR